MTDPYVSLFLEDELSRMANGGDPVLALRSKLATAQCLDEQTLNPWFPVHYNESACSSDAGLCNWTPCRIDPNTAGKYCTSGPLILFPAFQQSTNQRYSRLYSTMQ